MKRNNRKPVHSKPKPVTVYVERPTGVSYTFEELAMHRALYGPYGSTSFSVFNDQIATIRKKAAIIAAGF